MDDGSMLVGAVGAGGFFLFLIVVVWQIAATWRARAIAAREEQYKQLALKYARLLEDNVELHRRTADQIAETRDAVCALEGSTRARERELG